MTIRIGSLRMRLPSNYNGRGDAIARALAQGLTQLHPVQARSFDALSLGPIRVAAGASNDQIAAAVLRQLRSRLGERS